MDEDLDPQETAEWLESLEAVRRAAGPERVDYLLKRLATTTRYINTVPTSEEPAYPGDLELEERIAAYDRWNAAAMITRGSRLGLGGHLATYASAAWLYEVGFNHFFHAGRDQVYFQGHASPGIYARAFLEGRLSEAQLDLFRREPEGGLPSYPHPRSMPDFWQFPTVSMGLGPLNAVYQARFNRYLHNRGIKDTSHSHVWAFLGDGEMDEPESTAALTLAAREGLDNLTFVINCNLQRLDGPVRGNTRIVQELESVFRGAGWHVVKALWGREWDGLLGSDELVARLGEVPDGQFQTFAASTGAYIRERLFQGLDVPCSDDDLRRIVGGSRAGHEPRKVYAAYRRALDNRGAPTVILVQTVKGWTLGAGIEARNANHQMKKLTQDEFRALRDRLGLPVPRSVSPLRKAANLGGNDYQVTTPGTVLDGVHITGDLVINADGVTVRNSQIDGTVINERGTRQYSFTISDSTVGPANGCVSTPGVGESHYTATRVLVRGHGDGFRVSGDDVTIRDSYVHLCSNPGDHSDGIQTYMAGKGLVFQHNTVDQRDARDITAPIFITDPRVVDVTLTDNLVMGGTYSIQVKNAHGRVVVRNNRLVNRSWVYGPVEADCSSIDWSGNTLVTVDEDYRVTSTVGALPCHT